VAIFSFATKALSLKAEQNENQKYENSNLLDRKVGLQKHPEGGWFKEIYRSGDVVPETGLPENFNGKRNFSTSIYFLLEGGDFSAFHRIKSDEIWHYYTGNSAIEILTIENRRIKKQLVGNNLENDEQLQVVAPKNKWFAARLKNTQGFGLVGCTVSPGIHFDDFEMADEKLIDEFPELKEEIVPFLR